MEKPETIGQLIDLTGDGELTSVVSRAESLSHGKSFREAKIKSVAEMGDAAGTCHMETGEISTRIDVAMTRVGIHEDLAHVLVHEGVHQDGCGLEGVTELLATERTGDTPVTAYADRVVAARELREVVGRARFEEIAFEKDAERLFIQEYFCARIQRAANLDTEDVLKEGRELVKKAA